jgi:hypothetical protein
LKTQKDKKRKKGEKRKKKKKKKLKKKKKNMKKTHTHGQAPSARLRLPAVRTCRSVPMVPDNRAVVVLHEAGMGDGGGRPECTKWVP